MTKQQNYGLVFGGGMIVFIAVGILFLVGWKSLQAKRYNETIAAGTEIARLLSAGHALSPSIMKDEYGNRWFYGCFKTTMILISLGHNGIYDDFSASSDDIVKRTDESASFVITPREGLEEPAFRAFCAEIVRRKRMLQLDSKSCKEEIAPPADERN